MASRKACFVSCTDFPSKLARQVGVSPNTGTAIYHKLAQVMLERDMDKPLSHKVEMDDVY